MNSITVYAKSFAQGEESRRKVGEFPAYDAALTAAAERVLGDLWAVFSIEQSAKDLFDLWKEMGDDVFIVPDDNTTPFSATDFARLMTLQVTLDDSRPLYLEVTCIDQLNFSSGFSSPPKQWVFWVKAPATYSDSGATPLIRRAAEVLYREMSQKALESEGSSYTLLDLTTRALSEVEVVQGIRAQSHNIIYVVQNDGTLVEEAT
jgi:hypothetical protein